MMKKILKFVAIIVVIPILYVVGTLIHGTLTDFKPQEVIPLEITAKQAAQPITKDTLSFMIWNLGYAGLGEESDFFFDNGGFLQSNGKSVRTTQANVEKNIAGTEAFLKAHQDIDFFMLQEVDFASKRSYYNNQYQSYQAALPDYSATFGVNYRSPRVPLPVLEPWNVMGEIESGLGTYARYTPSHAVRYQLPGEYPWPDRIFHLDRCAMFSTFPLANGKELLVVNIHNSAYDKGGILKKPQMKYLEEKLRAAYERGNYVVVGGDWNQRPATASATDFGGETLTETEGLVTPKDYLSDWIWAYDAKVPTNRSLKNAYKKGETTVNLIDFFVVSPNVKVLETTGINMDFKYSDHQPVQLKVAL